MNWQSTTVATEDLTWLVETIRALGGTIINSRPDAEGVHVTWATGTVPPARP